MAGEAEPLRPLGVNVSEENVSKQAKAMGMLNTQLTDQEKLLARIALIVKGLSYTEDDLAKTITEYANATRKAAGDWENFKALMGDEIKPVVMELIKAGYELKDVFAEAFSGDVSEAFAGYMAQAAIEVTSIKDAFKTIDSYGHKIGALIGIRFKALMGQDVSKDVAKLVATEKPKPAAAAAAATAEDKLADAKRTADDKRLREQMGSWSDPTKGNTMQEALGGIAGGIAAEGSKSLGAHILSDLQQGFDKLKDAGARVMQGPTGKVIGGGLTGGFGGAVKGAAEGGLLNKLVPAQMGPLSSHIMGGSDFATFAQEQVSSQKNEQVEAAKAAAKNTAELVAQGKESLGALKDLAKNFTGKARLAGP
jgi:hypothetical protein